MTSGSDTLASTTFTFPNDYAVFTFFEELTLPAGTYSLNIGNYNAPDNGWGLPIAGTLYTADGVSYLGTYGWHSPYYYVPDISIVSVPEPHPLQLAWLACLIFIGYPSQRRSIKGRS